MCQESELWSWTQKEEKQQQEQIWWSCAWTLESRLFLSSVRKDIEIATFKEQVKFG